MITMFAKDLRKMHLRALFLLMDGIFDSLNKLRPVPHAVLLHEVDQFSHVHVAIPIRVQQLQKRVHLCSIKMAVVHAIEKALKVSVVELLRWKPMHPPAYK